MKTKMTRGYSLKVGIIGCGDIAAYHARLIQGTHHPRLPAFPIRRLLRTGKRLLRGQWRREQLPAAIPGIDGVEIIAAADISPERLTWFCETFVVSHAYSDYKEVLARKDVDAVIICPPPYTHAEIAVAAARHGKHIFCEKPMAMTSEQCAQMTEVAREAGVVLQIGYVLRFSSERGRIRNAILNGEIGRPVFWREIYNPRGGPRQEWVHDAETGGGPIWENSHTLDFLRYAFGEPEFIFANGGRYKPENTTAIDTISVIFVFPSGDRALFTDSYGLAGFGWDKAGCRPNQVQVDVIGPKGFIQYPDRDLAQVLTICRYTDSGQDIEKQQWSSDWGADGYRQELEHFFECVREGKESVVPGEEGMRTIQLAEAVLHSVQTGEMRRFEV